MLDKKNMRYQIRILGIVATAIVFLAFFWFYQYKSITDIRETLVQTWSKYQYQMVEEIVGNAVSSQRDSGFDQYLIDAVAPKLRFTDTSYGFIYKSGRVLFEQNLDVTRQYEGEVIRDMYGTFSYQGGEHLLEVLEQMESKKSGMDYFVKNHFKGKEYVTWIIFDYAESSYLIGIVTPEVYILNEHNFVGIRNDAYVFSGIYTILLILFSSLLCFSLYRYKETVSELTDEMVKKNQFIQKEKKVVSDLEARLKQFVIKDTITGVYNRKFFDVLIEKLIDKVFLPLSVSLFSISDQESSMEEDELLRILAQACRAVSVNENNVITRYGNHEVAILMVNTPYDVVAEKANEVVLAVETEAGNRFSGGIAYGVATKHTEEASTKQMLFEAEEQLRLSMRDQEMAVQTFFEGSSISV